MAEPVCSVSVLTVSPFESDLVILSNVISHSAWNHRSARSLEEARTALMVEDAQVVLCETELPDGDWKETLEFTTELQIPPELIVLSRNADERLWATVLNLGAWDVLTPPFLPKDVYRTVHHAYRHWYDTLRLNRRKPGKSEPATSTFGQKVYVAGV